jgi:hypothetical protein
MHVTHRMHSSKTLIDEMEMVPRQSVKSWPPSSNLPQASAAFLGAI